MCYNYHNDLAVARSMYRKQLNQSLNSSNDINLRNTTRVPSNRSRIDQLPRLNTTTTTKQILLDKEYSNLKNLLPMLNNKAKVSKVNLINEAVRYINELQEQVIQKLNADPKIIQQKILEQFEQQVKAEPEITQNSNIDIVQSNSFAQPLQAIRSQNKSCLRRSPLEEINVQKSVKRKRV